MAFERAIFLSEKCGSRLDVVHVVQCEIGGDSAVTFEQIEELEGNAKEILERYKMEAVKQKVPIKVFFEIGDPAKIITEIVNKKEYDLIIMGSRGMSTFKELLLGSVSLKVMHHAKCPVMIVR
ncbi:MAG: nhaX 2 [Candidatus Nitrosotenuis sp.]|nr:nhaX 2 [Candidatus Nitrosotenuis sp.]